MCSPCLGEAECDSPASQRAAARVPSLRVHPSSSTGPAGLLRCSGRRCPAVQHLVPPAPCATAQHGPALCSANSGCCMLLIPTAQLQLHLRGRVPPGGLHLFGAHPFAACPHCAAPTPPTRVSTCWALPLPAPSSPSARSRSPWRWVGAGQLSSRGLCATSGERT